MRMWVFHIMILSFIENDIENERSVRSTCVVLMHIGNYNIYIPHTASLGFTGYWCQWLTLYRWHWILFRQACKKGIEWDFKHHSRINKRKEDNAAKAAAELAKKKKVKFETLPSAGTDIRIKALFDALFNAANWVGNCFFVACRSIQIGTKHVAVTPHGMIIHICSITVQLHLV